MIKILDEAISLLQASRFEHAVCGGYALDLFVGKQIREHGDIDICAFRGDKNNIIKYMKSNDWIVYEFCGQGIVHALQNDISNNNGNLMCLKDGCELIKFYPTDKGESYFSHEFFHSKITTFNYIEFLLNSIIGNNFMFSNDNNKIMRAKEKTILWCGDISYLMST